MTYTGVERRSRSKPGPLLVTVLAVMALSVGPIFLMEQTGLDRMMVFLICMPLSGLSYAWLWRERRQRTIQRATLVFAGCVCIWIAVFFGFVFQQKNEMKGVVLVFASICINILLFVLLNETLKKRRLRVLSSQHRGESTLARKLPRSAI